MTEQDENYGLWLKEYYDELFPEDKLPDPPKKPIRIEYGINKTIYIPEEMSKFLKDIGCGNRSYGLRRVFDAVKIPPVSEKKFLRTNVNLRQKDIDKVKAYPRYLFCSQSEMVRFLVLLYQIKYREVQEQKIIDETTIVF